MAQERGKLANLYTLKTDRGELYIREEFATYAEAVVAGYTGWFLTRFGYLCTDGHTNIAIVTSNKSTWDDTTTIGRDFRKKQEATS